ncbi:MAG TPA: ABC transporter permease subunit [Luteimicrobium sp.]|nr:ABC transporter permease subunit [Luteimicrobium sp.]
MSTTLRTQTAAPAPGAAAPGPGGTAEGRARVHAALESITHPARVDPVVLSLGILAWVAFALVCRLVPDSSRLPLSDAAAVQAAGTFTQVAALAVAAAWAGVWALSRAGGRVGAWATRKAAHAAAWVLGSGLWLLFWELSTAKSTALEPPYFVAPQEILQRLWEDRAILAESLGNSLLLLAVGFLVGLVTGLATGVLIGWSKVANYWVHPILMFLGPVPSLAWVPVAFVLFPTAYVAAVFMIALTVWFPITVLTRAGILGVPRSYYDVAQTLGAGTRFLVLRVSLPAALPSIFTGAFMALGASFVSLTVAENFGVNAGLGWYLNWQKGWGDFPAVYAGIVVLVVVCGALLTALLRLRSYVLRWEKELTRW